MTANGLSEFRKKIDALDDEIVALLARRFAVAEEVAAYKRKHGIAVRLEDRITQVLDRVGKSATKSGTDANAICAIYKTIIETTCRFEEAKIES